jgi:hypothetical protein
MSWLEWTGIWAFAIGTTAAIIGLTVLLGAWALLVVFPLVFVGLGLGVCR